MWSLQRKTKSRNTVLNRIDKAYENVNKTNEENIIATIDVIEKTFEKLCGLNSEIEELAEMQKITKKYKMVQGPRVEFKSGGAKNS